MSPPASPGPLDMGPVHRVRRIRADRQRTHNTGKSIKRRGCYIRCRKMEQEDEMTSIIFIALAIALLLITAAVGYQYGKEDGYDEGYYDGYDAGTDDAYNILAGRGL